MIFRGNNSLTVTLVCYCRHPKVYNPDIIVLKFHKTTRYWVLVVFLSFKLFTKYHTLCMYSKEIQGQWLSNGIIQMRSFAFWNIKTKIAHYTFMWYQNYYHSINNNFIIIFPPGATWKCTWVPFKGNNSMMMTLYVWQTSKNG